MKTELYEEINREIQKTELEILMLRSKRIDLERLKNMLMLTTDEAIIYRIEEMLVDLKKIKVNK